MIASFRHKGLQHYFDTGSVAGIQPVHARRLQTLLAALQFAKAIDDMDVPGYSLHALRRFTPPRWSVKVNGNWRMTFAFHDGKAFAVDYEDYH
ncbi:MAG: type II toxin-antitoxin system RelE/ParE family toxin [Sphingomonadaceae bacterium]